MAQLEPSPTGSSKTPADEVREILESVGYEGLTEVDAANRKHAIDILMSTSWDTLEAVEHNDYLMFKDVLIKRTATGTWKTEDVLLRVPRPKDLREARVEARELAKTEKLDEEKDRDLFSNLENMCILAKCIRNTTSPFEEMHPDPIYLEAHFDTVCLQRMWAKVEQMNEVLNPSPNQLSSKEIVALIVAIARARHLGPLVVYGPGAQTSLVVSMADLLLNLLGSKLSWESLEHLMQESSVRSDSVS